MSREIKDKIDALRLELEEALAPGMFTLNPKVVRINKEIEALQNNCNHHFIEGQCEFCYKLEGVNE